MNPNYDGDYGVARSNRIDAVDWLRGLVMVVMALDHVRDFFTIGGINPEDPTTASPALFFTRWITHFCAPTFVLLAGAGAYLYGAGGRSRGELAWFLLTRGLWLVVLELTRVRWSALFNLDYHFSFGQVIWAIGWSMVILSGLVWLPVWSIGLLGLAIVTGQHLLDGVPAERFHVPPALWDLFLRQRAFEIARGYVFFNVYPLFAWIGVLFAGYGFGSILQIEPERRRRLVLAMGLAMTVAFIALRWFHLYGDPRPWTPQADTIRTVMAFLACSKYPPSLQFLLMTLGPALVVLALVDRPQGPPVRPLVTFGRVPLFFYLLHFPLIHGSALGLALLRYGWADWLVAFPTPNAPPPPPDAGLTLQGVYLVWVLVVFALYWPCRWFAGVKQRHPGGVLSYF